MKSYQTSRSLDYLLKTKSHIQKLLHSRGLSQLELSRVTGIPRNSLQRWLSTNNGTFMGVRDMAMIAEYLRIPLCAMYPEPTWLVASDERLAQLSRIEGLPTDHIEAFADFYSKLFTTG